MPPYTNPYKSDVFTIGMIMLEAGLLEAQDDCYRDECSRVHWDTVKFNLERFGEIYSSELKKTVESMLEEAWQDRPEWIDLETHVKIGDEYDEVSSIPPTPISRGRDSSIREVRQSQEQSRRVTHNHEQD